MSRVADYGYANAKLRARIGSIRESKTIDDMIKAPNLVEAINALKNTRHSHLVDVYDKTGDLQQVELALFSEEVETYKEVIKMLPGKNAAFVEVLLEKLEIENLKNLMRMWYSEVVRHHSIKYRAGYLYRDDITCHIDAEAIINAPDYDTVLNAVKDSKYYDVLKGYSLQSITSKGLFDLEIALDHLFFSDLFKAVERLDKADSDIASSIYLMDMDLKNILLLIRYGYYHEIDKEELKRVIIPYGYIYNAGVSHKLLSSDNAVSVLREIIGSRYGEVGDEIDRVRRMSDDITTKSENADSILHIEKFLSKVRETEYRKILSGDPLSIGVILAYFFISNHEDAKIRAILSAKLYKWSEAKIREEVV